MSFGRKGVGGDSGEPVLPSRIPSEEGDSLSDIFRRLIANTGPISVMQYMGEANARYYASRDPLGVAGDFVTAPEISQMFGELTGLWLADLWARAGSPRNTHYVELGPGRGTLARDALRAAEKFGFVPTVHLVEASPVLRGEQREQVRDVFHHDDLSTVPTEGPILLVANEFFDALPVRQVVRMADGWRERMVGLEDDRFLPVAGNQPMDAAVPEARRDAPEGTILEVCPGAATLLSEIGSRLARQGGAALIVDYGYVEPQAGSTLQAVRAHAKVDPFAAPGEADLTAHVDFAMLARVAESRGAASHGMITQGAWLKAMGIDQRTQTLAAAAPDQAEALATARDRLVNDDQMGTLFKAMALAHPDWPRGAGFEV